MSPSDHKPIVLTGLRANAEFTLGNYFGGIMPMVNLAKRLSGQYIINMFVPDLHSFTTDIEFSKLKGQILDHFAMFIACGLDINNPDINIYRQSHIPAHSELTVILNNFTYFGELSRMTQFKEKSDQAKNQNVTVGLFDYPVLMAADILLYSAKYIPVGEDQRQHIELARDLADRFNKKFNQDIFTLPETWDKQIEFAHSGSSVRIMSLKDPLKKMSKSIDNPTGTILLSDSVDDVRAKIMSATTDSVGNINYDPASQPGITNLLNILGALEGQDIEKVKAEWVGQTDYAKLKTAVADAVCQLISTIQAAKANVDLNLIESKLTEDEQKMTEVANSMLSKVQEVIGLSD